MTILERVAEMICSKFPDAPMEIDKKEKSISITLDDIPWKIFVATKNHQMLWRKNHFYMRLKNKMDELPTILQTEHAKTLEQDQIREAGEALCHYIQDDGNLPEGLRVVNVNSNLNGGIMSIRNQDDDTITVITKIDPPVVEVKFGRMTKTFELADPDCAQNVASHIRTIAL